MSSYLNIYIKKKTVEEPITIGFWSRSSDLYQRFYEEINPASAESEDKYTEIDNYDMNRLTSSIREEIMDAEKRLNVYKQYAQNNSEYIEQIISSSEYIEELVEHLGEVRALENIVNSQHVLGNKVLCNID